MTDNTHPDTRPHARRLGRFGFLLAVLALAGGGAYYLWNTYFRAPDPTAGYQYATVQRGDIEDVVTATGTLQPRDYVDVGAQVSGLLTQIHVEIGSEVKAGDLLAEIDPTVLQSRVDATRAQLRNQRAQLIDREASLLLAQLQHRRQLNLMAEDATTREALQSAEAALRSAQAQIEALKAQIDQTESNLRADEANLEYSRIYAPIDGTIVSITARQGQTLNASQQAPTILRVADLSTMSVQTQVSEADVGKLRIGMPAWFSTLGSRGKRWHGTLQRIEPTPVVQNNVVLYNALFDVPNEDRSLMTQMTAQVFFVVDSASDALFIPMSALAAASAVQGPTARNGVDRPSRQGRSATAGAGTIMVAAPDGSIRQRAVEFGVSNRVQIEVRSGLEEGERVVSGITAGPAGTGIPGQRGALGS
ncbi:MAG TPA: efflux RND transporter periplasmic adaptor subunit [Rhodocyclaceae bacterium]|nr:efflux RND transporter periplasmic adaptor subunit [Rhodocyclaceae bacterium]HRQ48009.1 efflux RND transporter periplasmic adaptor subunit [Rhodocyclaceae bacterium]